MAVPLEFAREAREEGSDWRPRAAGEADVGAEFVADAAAGGWAAESGAARARQQVGEGRGVTRGVRLGVNRPVGVEVVAHRRELGAGSDVDVAVVVVVVVAEDVEGVVLRGRAVFRGDADDEVCSDVGLVAVHARIGVGMRHGADAEGESRAGMVDGWANRDSAGLDVGADADVVGGRVRGERRGEGDAARASADVGERDA